MDVQTVTIEPRTDAGRRLLAEWGPSDDMEGGAHAEFRVAIRAVEREAGWYVERFSDGTSFDWLAQLRRTLGKYERERDPLRPLKGDVDLAEALTALHAIERLAGSDREGEPG